MDILVFLPINSSASSLTVTHLEEKIVARKRCAVVWCVFHRHCSVHFVQTCEFLPALSHRPEARGPLDLAVSTHAWRHMSRYFNCQQSIYWQPISLSSRICRSTCLSEVSTTVTFFLSCKQICLSVFALTVFSSLWNHKLHQLRSQHKQTVFICTYYWVHL